MASTPCCCVELACKGGDLINKRGDGRDGGFANNRLNRDGDHAATHHFGDGGHGGCDGSHYFPATVARVLVGCNILPRRRRWWCARAAAASAACGDGGAQAWTAATVDGGGIVGSAAVAVVCTGGGWQPVMAAEASAACGGSSERVCVACAGGI